MTTMTYLEFQPEKRLRHCVKCYYLYESASDTAFQDTVFASGSIEIIFNLGSGQWLTEVNGSFRKHPAIELWGQITRPLPVKSTGKNTMLGVRLFPHAASCFLDDHVELFNNQVLNYGELSGMKVKDVHDQLLEANSISERLLIIENFLLKELSARGKQCARLPVVINVMEELKRRDFFDNIDNVASRYGITSRYLQKLFLQHTGLTPKMYSKINRFQNSLKLMTRENSTLTSVAYDCGYFDQSHFIREFKSFTGFKPSLYSSEYAPITFASVGA